jgi:hypothetical protein
MEIINTLSLAMGAGWASGLNLYATVFMLGIMHATGSMVLPPELQILAHPLVLGAAGIMYVVEFLADKVPGFDSAWDTLHTFIRIPAGAMLAGGAVGDMGMAAEFAAFLMGGGLAAGSHATKAGSRVMINTSPEPFSNWTASVTEDVAVVGGLWAALNHPWVFIGLLAAFILFMIWLLPKIWHGIKKVFGWLFGKDKTEHEGL